ncbi:MAG: cytochrome c oxidase subunit 3 [Haliscomenobacter sp.]|nr:cytochrome c oxidase subunit 3 [Haliscomenobacter sp.]MBK8653491.1 cytochrome c oxidase subunit 3 [Haliscomenobacter sp.]
MENPNRPNKENPYNEYDNFAFHPSNVFLVLLLLGLSALFLSLSAAFVYNRVQSGLPPVRIPLLFLFNTLILAGGSWSMEWAKTCYKQDRTADFQKALLLAMGLSLLFLLAQFLGWRSLLQQNLWINSGNAASYLYVISGLHFLHVVGGFPFLLAFYSRARNQTKEPVRALVFFSDPEQALRLRLLRIYWHFLDGLWIYLVLFFFINDLIR